MSRRGASALDLLVEPEATYSDMTPVLEKINEMIGYSTELPEELYPFDMSEEALRQLQENFDRKHKKRARDESSSSIFSAQTPSKRLRSSARLHRDPNASQEGSLEHTGPPRFDSREREEKDVRKEEKEVRREDMRPFSKKSISEDDLMALMSEAKRLKHEGDQRRKEAKTNDALLDYFLTSYLEAFLFYLRCGQYYEKHQKRDWIDQARKLYDDTAKLAQFATSQVRFPCSPRRRALTALLEKAIAVCYGRKFWVEKKQLQVTIHSGADEDRMVTGLSSLDRAANDAAAFWLKSRRSDPSLEEMDSEFDRPLQVGQADFIRYIERQITILFEH